LIKLKRLELALEDLNSACELEPISQNFFSRAGLYSDLAQYENALNDLTFALEKDDSSNFEFKIRCCYRRAVVYFDLGKKNNINFS
jgi:tetratricopeptide (TPR) repeat protein